MPKQKVEVEKVPIEGLDEFPLEILGLTPESIEKSDGHIKIPIELLPYIKIVRTPTHIRQKRAKYKRDYLLRLKAKESQEYLKRKIRSTRKEER
jgi:hypothetical protein